MVPPVLCNMNYIIIKKFGKNDERWEEYAQWAGLEHCSAYYSIDGIIRENLFDPESVEDWENCINEDHRTHIITNLSYAMKILPKYANGEVIGIVCDPRSHPEKVSEDHELAGYDIIEGRGTISLVTNWGGKECGIENLELNQHALIDDLNDAYAIRDFLRENCSEDAHAVDCEVWAIYKIIRERDRAFNNP